jgi:hypothetical protein
MKLTKSSVSESNFMGFAVLIPTVLVIVWMIFSDKDTGTVEVKSLAVQVLESCMSNPRSSPSACLEAYYNVKGVLSEDVDKMPVDVPTNVEGPVPSNVPNHNSGSAYAPNMSNIPLSTCQGSIGGQLWSTNDPLCERWPSKVK